MENKRISTSSQASLDRKNSERKFMDRAMLGIRPGLGRSEVTRLTLVTALAMTVGLVGFSNAPKRNRIEGTVLGRSGNTSTALPGIRVYLLDLSDHEQNAVHTDSAGKFSIIAPVELLSFRLLFEDDTDKY